MVALVSAHGRSLIEQWEGLRLREYRDEAGYPSIGYGHKLTAAEIRSGLLHIGDRLVRFTPTPIAREDADALLVQDLTIPEVTLQRFVAVELEQCQFDSLASLCFNIGRSAFIASTLLERLNAGGYDEVPSQLARWVFVTVAGQKVRSDGLVVRRNREVALWEGRI